MSESPEFRRRTIVLIAADIVRCLERQFRKVCVWEKGLTAHLGTTVLSAKSLHRGTPSVICSDGRKQTIN